MSCARKIISIFLSVLLLLTLVVGCSQNADSTGTNNKTENDAAASNNQEETTNNANGGSEEDIDLGLPIVDEPVTLTYWVPMHQNATKLLKTLNDNEIFKELEKRTGIKMEFIHPPLGQESEQFNLLISTRDYPDILSSGTYPGGADKAIEDGAYIRLNELVDKYAPNFKAVIESNPEIEKRIKTDNGNIWGFPCIHIEEEPCWCGPIVRKDYLDDLGLDIPKTVDDWYTMLKAFKDEKGLPHPMLLSSSGIPPYSGILSAYGVASSFYREGDTVKYGPIEEGFKQYLETISKWYEEGLIDKDFATRDRKSIESLITNGETGAWFGAFGEDIQAFVVIMKDDPNFELVGVPYPSLVEGEKVKYRQQDPLINGWFASITSECEHPELVVRWFDYAYSEEGSTLFNWGIEGQSYEIVDGEPRFTDLMLNNPDGLPFFDLAWKYKVHVGSFLRDWVAQPAYMTYPEGEEPLGVKESREAAYTWTDSADTDHIMPPLTLTQEENERLSTIMADIETYVSEMVLQFVMGVQPIDKFDEFVEQIKSMGIEEAIQIQQAALDRYNQR